MRARLGASLTPAPTHPAPPLPRVLCNTAGDSVAAATEMNTLFHALDPLGNRPVSANQNGWVGPKTPLDVQGFE